MPALFMKGVNRYYVSELTVPPPHFDTALPKRIFGISIHVRQSSPFLKECSLTIKFVWHTKGWPVFIAVLWHNNEKVIKYARPNPTSLYYIPNTPIFLCANRKAGSVCVCVYGWFLIYITIWQTDSQLNTHYHCVIKILQPLSASADKPAAGVE